MSKVQRFHCSCSIHGVVEVDVGVSEGAARVDVPADADRHDLPGLAKELVELRVRDGRLQVADVQRRGRERLRDSADADADSSRRDGNSTTTAAPLTNPPQAQRPNPFPTLP